MAEATMEGKPIQAAMEKRRLEQPTVDQIVGRREERGELSRQKAEARPPVLDAEARKVAEIDRQVEEARKKAETTGLQKDSDRFADLFRKARNILSFLNNRDR